VGALRALGITTVQTLLLRRSHGRAHHAGGAPAGAFPPVAGDGLSFAALPRAHRGGGRRNRAADQWERRRHCVGGTEHAKAGTLDARARGTARCARAHWCRRRVRLSRWTEEAGAALDATQRARMALPARIGAATSVAALSHQQSAVRLPGVVASDRTATLRLMAVDLPASRRGTGL